MAKYRVEITYDVIVPDTLEGAKNVVANFISEGLIEPDDVTYEAEADDTESDELGWYQEFIAYILVAMSHGGDAIEAVTQVNDNAWEM